MKESVHDATVLAERPILMQHGDLQTLPGYWQTMPAQPSRHMLPDYPFCAVCDPFTLMNHMNETHYCCPRCGAKLAK